MMRGMNCRASHNALTHHHQRIVAIEMASADQIQIVNLTPSIFQDRFSNRSLRTTLRRVICQ
jgi:hypothetical protein